MLSEILPLKDYSVAEANSSAKSLSTDNTGDSTSIVCGMNLLFFGGESRCTGFHRLSPQFSIGARALLALVVEDKSESFLLLSEIRPFAGSYHVDFGIGYCRRLGWLDDSWSNGIVWDIRMGNRWTIPNGLTLGVQYLGAQFFESGEVDVFVLFGPEIGWSF